MRQGREGFLRRAADAGPAITEPFTTEGGGSVRSYQNFVLATDLGQTGNPSPADGLQLFVTDLMKAGVGKDEVTKMGREVTGGLLMG